VFTLSRMVMTTKVIGKMVKERAVEYTTGKQVKNLMEIGEKTRCMDKV